MKANVTGTKQLSAKLKSLSTDMQKNLERALTVGALVIQNRAKATAPVVTGNLRRSIHIGGHEDLAPDYSSDVEHRSNERVPSAEATDGSVTVYVGTDVEYAPSVEFGDGTRRPHPFMRPAYDEGRSEAMSEVSEALADIIRAAAQ